MARRARAVIPHVPHHVTQRGNRRGDVFKEPEDRHAYLEFLREYSRRHRVLIWAYALMSNHVHFIVLPDDESGLSGMIRDTHSSYASWFNWKHGLAGHLWHSRFYSAPLDEYHLRAAVRYVERNPVRAGMVDRAADYAWSSARPHVRGQEDRYLDPGLPFAHEISDWERWLASDDPQEELKLIRQATSQRAALWLCCLHRVAPGTLSACESAQAARSATKFCGRNVGIVKIALCPQF